MLIVARRTGALVDGWNGSMWFRRYIRSEDELRMRGDAYLERPAIDGSDALPMTRNAILESPVVDSSPVVSTAPLDLHVQSKPIKQFKPRRRRQTRNLVIGARASSEVYAAYNTLRAQIIKRLQENGWNRVAITSPSRGAGTTLTAINLAISMARGSNCTVVLVELDFANPSFRQRLGFKQREGIVDYLLRDVPIEDVLLDPGIDRLVVLPAGSSVRNGSELLSSPKMTKLMEELKLRYPHPIIMFDFPSVRTIEYAIASATFVDCALLVAEVGETRLSDIQRAINSLGSIEILGIALNRSTQV
jgi:protein-tyrosine kinase